MRYDQYSHHRQSLRLREYDYSKPGAYFITICAFRKECLFGEIANGRMQLNELGEIVKKCWYELPNHYENVVLDEFVIMQNHVHGIVIIDNDNVGAGLKPAPTKSVRHGLPEIVRGFKTFSARHINEFRDTMGTPVWQRNYYERVMRNDAELRKIREYIIANPAMWGSDEENPANL